MLALSNSRAYIQKWRGLVESQQEQRYMPLGLLGTDIQLKLDIWLDLSTSSSTSGNCGMVAFSNTHVAPTRA